HLLRWVGLSERGEHRVPAPLLGGGFARDDLRVESLQVFKFTEECAEGSIGDFRIVFNIIGPPMMAYPVFEVFVFLKKFGVRCVHTQHCTVSGRSLLRPAL